MGRRTCDLLSERGVQCTGPNLVPLLSRVFLQNDMFNELHVFVDVVFYIKKADRPFKKDCFLFPGFFRKNLFSKKPPKSFF